MISFSKDINRATDCEGYGKYECPANGAGELRGGSRTTNDEDRFSTPLQSRPRQSHIMMSHGTLVTRTMDIDDLSMMVIAA